MTYWVVGMHNQFLKDGEKVLIENIEYHPKLKSFEAYEDYDMVLTRTSNPIEFKKNVHPICLPKIGEDIVAKEGIIAGW